MCFQRTGWWEKAPDAGQAVWPRIKAYDVTGWLLSINKLQGAKALHRYCETEFVGGR